MPPANKRSRIARELRHQGHTGFAKHANAAPTPEGSVYCPSDSDADEQAIDMDDIGDDQAIASDAEGLQRLYADFLPEDLQLNRVHPQNKHKRPVVYTGDSSTTAWQRKMAQRKVAKGCGMLDAFIQWKVGSGKPNEVKSAASHCPQKRQRSLSPLDSEGDVMEVIDVDTEEGLGVQSAARPPVPNPALPGPIEASMQSAAIPVVSKPANILVRSGEDRTATQPVAQSAADLATPCPDTSIDNAIDELLTRLAAFCLDQLEKSVTSSDGVDLNADVDVLANELQVRMCIPRRTKQRVQ
jgi:hypothetical protein